jgi:hypothetical protein
MTFARIVYVYAMLHETAIESGIFDNPAPFIELRNSSILQGIRAVDPIELFSCTSLLHNEPVIFGYARVSTDGQSVGAQVRQLRAAGAGKVFRETASGAKTARAQLRRVLAELGPGDVVTVTRLDRLARSTRDLLNTLAAITEKKVGFRSLADGWADTTTAHGRLMLTVLGRPGGVRARADPRPRQGEWAKPRSQAEAHPASEAGSNSPA